MAGWCCGRLGDLIPEKIAKKLIELLKDPYWKVRTAACVVYYFQFIKIRRSGQWVLI